MNRDITCQNSTNYTLQQNYTEHKRILTKHSTEIRHNIIILSYNVLQQQ